MEETDLDFGALVYDKTKNTVPDFVNGVLLLIDKPYGWTSFDVVNKVRSTIKHKFGIKKIKVGHAGTLDPLATGLLLICTGKLTKSIDTLQAKEKVYTGSILLGKTTPTYDSESEPDAIFETHHIQSEQARSVATKFVGVIQQVPPIYSAIKIDGKAAYTLARKGKDVILNAREIEIFTFELTHVAIPVVEFKVKCSKGTYIRSLAHDFGKALDSGGHLTSLRREAIGSYQVEKAWTVQEFVDLANSISPVQNS